MQENKLYLIYLSVLPIPEILFAHGGGEGYIFFVGLPLFTLFLLFFLLSYLQIRNDKEYSAIRKFFLSFIFPVNILLPSLIFTSLITKILTQIMELGYYSIVFVYITTVYLFYLFLQKIMFYSVDKLRINLYIFIGLLLIVIIIEYYIIYGRVMN